MVKKIQGYFDDVLIPQLKKYGVSSAYQTKIVRAVSKQIYSVLANWEDRKFINTLFLTVSEEAPFYYPEADIDVKSFVVLTVRNSPIETLQSDNFHKSGLTNKLTDEQLIEITSGAITYFCGLDFNEFEDDEDYNYHNDVYYQLSQKYEIVWNALWNVANSNAQCGSFQGFTYKTLPEHLKIRLNQKSNSEIKSSMVDGYEKALDNDLKKQLAFVLESKSVLTIDCFKMLSRNMEKLLCVIDLLLQNHCGFATSNYYIENGYFEKRETVLKAASSANAIGEMREHYSNFVGVGEAHKNCMIATFAE